MIIKGYKIKVMTQLKKNQEASAAEKVLTFASQAEFEKWLDEHYEQHVGIWLKFAKKDSGKTTINYDQALDIALCYGWIDGQTKRFDELYWLQKFTPRRSRSPWSKRNTEHVDRLIASGKMQPSGLAEVEKAKADGRWAAAYDSQQNMPISKDFLEELEKFPKAKAFFDSLNKANRFAIAYQLHSAKKPETRLRRLQKFVEMMKKGEKLH
jgi:uncharacterized protein YdeI (YjbR/CyaY-like superfamily)